MKKNTESFSSKKKIIIIIFHFFFEYKRDRTNRQKEWNSSSNYVVGEWYRVIKSNLLTRVNNQTRKFKTPKMESGRYMY